jgi:hypothetical protein
MNTALRRRIARAMRRQQELDDEHESARFHAALEARLAAQKLRGLFNGWEFFSALARHTEAHGQHSPAIGSRSHAS